MVRFLFSISSGAGGRRNVPREKTILPSSGVTMNGKAGGTKELNAKHRKILEGLLKLPENRECADCNPKVRDGPV